MGETQAFGTSLLCVSRRHFILVFCYLSLLVCIVQVLSFISPSASTSVRAFVSGDTNTPRPPMDCSGMQCYEVFSCFGFKESTYHMRNPFFFLFGLFFFPRGGYGAHYALERATCDLCIFLAVFALLHLFVIAADGLYVQQCSAYPLNVVDVSLTGWLAFPPFGALAKEKLRQMTSWPIQDVQQITNGYNVLLRYYIEAGLVASLLLYAAVEAYRLAGLIQSGPLGMGTFYGLAQWDEQLDHDAIRRRRERQIRSKFIDDARLPLKPQGDAELGAGFTVYGSSAEPGTIAAVIAAASQEHDDWGFGNDEANGDFEVNSTVYNDNGQVEEFLDAQEEEAKLAWHQFERRRQLN